MGRISSPIPALWIQSEVDEFVSKLIHSKRTQGEAYSAVWILIFERTRIFTAADLLGAPCD